MATLLADWSLAKVAEFRAALGVSQVALAERVGLSRPTLAKIESGEPTKLSTVNFLVTRLQEEYGDLFDVIEVVEVGANARELRFARREPTAKTDRGRSAPVWASELDALARKIMEVTNPRNAGQLAAFHGEFLDVLESYVKLSGLEISLKIE